MEQKRCPSPAASPAASPEAVCPISAAAPSCRFREGIELRLRESFWKQLLDRNLPLSPEELPDAAAQCGVDISGFLQPVYVKVLPPNPLMALTQPESTAKNHTAAFLLRRLTYSAFRQFPGTQLLSIDENAYLILIPYSQSEAPFAGIEQACLQIIDDFHAAGEDSMFMLGDAADIHQIVRNVRRLAEHAGGVMYIDNRLLPSHAEQPLISDPPQPNVLKIISLLDSGMYNEARRTLQDFLYDIRVIPLVSARFLSNYKYRLLDSLRTLEVLRHQDTDIFHMLPTELSDCSDRSVQEFLRMFDALCQKLEELTRLQGTVKKRDLAEEAKIQILENLDLDVSRGSLAAQYYVTPDYLDRLFRKKLGMTVAAFIRQQRLLLACQMLTGSDLTVTEISQRAGFTSPAYFCSIFREQLGQSPLQYRRTHTRTGENTAAETAEAVKSAEKHTNNTPYSVEPI